MKDYNKKFFIITILILIIIPTVNSQVNTKTTNQNFCITKQYHRNILIISDKNFTEQNGVYSGTGTPEDPYIISNLKFRPKLTDLFNDFEAIKIRDTKAHFIIKNCQISFFDGRISYILWNLFLDKKIVGINLHNVSNATIQNITIKGLHQAIHIENNSCYNKITNVSIKNTFCGIGICKKSMYNKIKNCKTNNYGCGICVYQKAEFNEITNCKVKRVGFVIQNSSNNLYKNCTAINCKKKGFLIIDKSENNKIKNCILTKNNIALYIDKQSNNNLIYHNDFLNNKLNAYDNCTNKWDNDFEGNYWDDYSDVDNNKDGIWDNPKKIIGGSNQDRYPFVNPIN